MIRYFHLNIKQNLSVESCLQTTLGRNLMYEKERLELGLIITMYITDIEHILTQRLF